MKKHKGSMLAYLNRETQGAQEETVYEVRSLPVRLISVNEKNFYSIEGIEEMANSLSVSEHVPPLEVVANDDGTYRLISGERRLCATRVRMERGELGADAELPCHILPAFEAKGPLSAEQSEMLSIILANNYRHKTPLDELNEVKELEPIARAIYEDAKEKGELEEDGKNMKFRTFFAKEILNISDSSLHRLQSLTYLSEKAAKALNDGSISKNVAVFLAGNLPPEVQDVFIEDMEKGEIEGTLADAERYLKDIEDTYDEEIHPTPEADTEDEADDEEVGEAPASGDKPDAPETASEDEATESEPRDWEDDDEEDPEEDSFEEEDHQDLFDVSVPEGLSPQEAEDEAKKWVVGVLERTLGDVEVKIDALAAAGQKTESARWGVRLSMLKLLIQLVQE